MKERSKVRKQGQNKTKNLKDKNDPHMTGVYTPIYSDMLSSDMLQLMSYT